MHTHWRFFCNILGKVFDFRSVNSAKSLFWKTLSKLFQTHAQIEMSKTNNWNIRIFPLEWLFSSEKFEMCMSSPIPLRCALRCLFILPVNICTVFILPQNQMNTTQKPIKCAWNVSGKCIFGCFNLFARNFQLKSWTNSLHLKLHSEGCRASQNEKNTESPTQNQRG